MSVFSIEHSCIDPARNNLSLIKTAAISAKKYFEKRAVEHRTFELCLENTEVVRKVKKRLKRVFYNNEINKQIVSWGLEMSIYFLRG